MGKESGSNVSSRLWGGALHDETQNSCERDYEPLGPCCLGLFQTPLRSVAKPNWRNTSDKRVASKSVQCGSQFSMTAT